MQSLPMAPTAAATPQITAEEIVALQDEVRALAAAPEGIPVEIECATRDEVDQALAAGATSLLLDNMTIGDLREAVSRVGGRARTEASGGIDLDSVRSIAETGVDFISVGALTHSAPAIDISFELEPI